MLSKTKIKYIQTLGQKKFREAEAVFIAEGPKMIEELLASASVVITELFAVEDWINKSKKKSRPGLVITAITEQELKKISQLSAPNNVLAIVKQFNNDDFAAKGKGIVLALDAIRDPGNLGTIVRIADWFGITHIVCSKDCADLYNAKVVQATMGSIARVTVLYTDLANWLSREKNIFIYATALEGRDITVAEKIEEGIVIIGNESKGIRQDILNRADKITIPRKGRAESLNAAVATGIVLSHICQ